MPYKDSEKRKAYNKSPQRKEAQRKRMQKYNNSPEGKKYRTEWYYFKGGKDYTKKKNKEYWQSSKGKAIRKKHVQIFSKSQKGKNMWRRRHLRRRYGITLDEYNRLFEAQHGRCAICFEFPKDNKNLCIDHDHKCCPGETICGKCIRGLLCQKCNTVLGMGKDSILLFQEVLRYLERRQ